MILLELLVIFFGVLALIWAVYAAFRAVIEGRRSPGTVITLMALGLIFLALLGQHNWLVGLDAFSRSDRAEIFMEPVQGRVGGTVRGFDFLNCTIHWYDRPGVRG